MLNFDEAKKRIFENVHALSQTNVAIEDAISLVLAADIAAPIDFPPFSNFSMDGFALAFADIEHGRGTRFAISQWIMAGDFPSALKAGTCVKIMTGAPLPVGADTVIPIEDAIENGGNVEFTNVPKKGQYVRLKGEDVKLGQIVARSGKKITSRHVALFAALGLTHVAAHRRPSVAIITTGSELVSQGAALKPGQIYDSNAPALTAALSEMGICAKCFAVSDDAEKTLAAVTRALENSDILITVGGVSVGDSDHVKNCLESLGAALVFWRIAMKPGKPFAFWTMRDKLIFGIPGNPVSCLVTFELLVKPAISRMMGMKKIENKKRTAIAACRLLGEPKRRNFICGRFWKDDDRIMVEPSGPTGSAMIMSLSDANCLIIVPEDVECVEVGRDVEIELL